MRSKNVTIGGLAIVLTLAVAPTLLCAQALPEKAVDDRAKRVMQLVDAAHALPIEFRADIQLQAIESGALPRGERAQDVLERLIESAGTVKDAYPLGRVFLTAQSVENERSNATKTLNDLDALSIETRAIFELSTMERPKALQALREIKVQIPLTACKSALIPDVAKYYGTLELLGAATFSDAEKRRGADVAWYEENVRDMSSALQLAPLADFLVRTRLPTEQFERISVQYAATLQTQRATDRELGWLEVPRAVGPGERARYDGEHRLIDAIRKLAIERRRRGLSADAIVSSYREFLVHSSEQVPCADLTADWPAILDAFNRMRGDVGVSERIPALTLGDLQLKSSTGERAQMRMIPDIAGVDSLFAEIYALREKAGVHATAEQLQVDTEDWNSAAAELLTKLDAYDPTKEVCVECAYIAKTTWLMGFFDFCPDDAYKRQSLSQLVNVLRTSPLQAETPVTWLFEMKLLLNISRKASGEQLKEIQKITAEGQMLNMLPSVMGKEIREEMKRSGDYTMYVYVEADEVLGNKFFSPYLE